MTKLHLKPDSFGLTDAPSTEEATVSYGGLSDGVTFFSTPLLAEMEVTGPLASKLWISSATEDADMEEVVY